MAEVRIQKILSELGVCSRREAEKMIKAGRVKVNGRPVTIGDKIETLRSVLSVDGKRIHIPKRSEFYYYMLNKPRGYITTLSDELGRRSIADFTKELPVRVFPVGRLDKDSEGLIILTNDGNFANMLTHPSHEIKKLYRVTVTPHADEEQILELATGVVLDDGIKTKPCNVRVVVDEPNRTVLEMTIKEGRNRQIRRMCSAVGLQVARLTRKAVGPLKLSMLQSGKMRELKPSEVIALKGAAKR